MAEESPSLSAHVASLLRELARRRGFEGDNPYRLRALERAANTIEKMGDAFEARLVRGTLKEVPGLGQGVLSLVDELLRTGAVAELEAARSRVPDILMQMAGLPGLGAKLAGVVHRELGIQTLGELEYAAHENRLARVQGVGPLTQERVLRALRQHQVLTGSCRLETADAAAGELCGALALLPGVVNVEAVGAVRRRLEVVPRVDVLVACEDPEAVMEKAVSAHMVRGATVLDARTVAFEAAPGVEGVLHSVGVKDWAAALCWWTGSTAHVLALQERLPWKLTEDGARDRKGKPVSVESEEALHLKAGLPAWLPPELRDDAVWIERAIRDGVPALVTMKDLRGTLHNHTLRSDGRNSMTDMQEAAHALGLQYLGISEHSQSATYARGLSGDGLKLQRAEMESVASLPGTRLLHGVESDILENGNLDYAAPVLEELEFVIASVHSRFKQDAERMTARLLKAVAHPAVDVLGHPTGRLLLSRDPSAYDEEAVFEACAEHGVAVEINGHPQRMDPNPVLVRKAVDAGARVLLSADAHSVDALRHVRFALDVARRAALTRKDVVNTQGLEGVREWLGRRRPL